MNPTELEMHGSLTELEIEAIIIAKQDRKQESPSIHLYPIFPHRYTWKGPTEKGKRKQMSQMACRTP